MNDGTSIRGSSNNMKDNNSFFNFKNTLKINDDVISTSKISQGNQFNTTFGKSTGGPIKPMRIASNYSYDEFDREI